MKKISALTIIILMLLLLSGCGAAGAGGATTEPSVSIPIWYAGESDPDPLWW